MALTFRALELLLHGVPLEGHAGAMLKNILERISGMRNTVGTLINVDQITVSPAVENAVKQYEKTKGL